MNLHEDLLSQSEKKTSLVLEHQGKLLKECVCVSACVLDVEEEKGRANCQ